MAGWNGAFYNGVFHNGWDMFTTSAIPGVMIGSQGQIVTTNARFGDGQVLQLTGGNTNGWALLVNLAHEIQGIYVFVPALPTTGFSRLIYWVDATAGSVQLQLMVGALGQLQFFLANGTTAVGAASANGIIATNHGYYIQTDITINSSAGIVKCYVDTQGSSPVISSSGVNSQTTANSFINQAWFNNPFAATIYYDDFYMLDLTGSAPFNALLGPMHEHWDVPTSDAGPNQFSTQPTQTTGNHFKNVNAVTTPSGTAYNFDNNPGDEELYGFPAITAATVFCMTEWIYSELDAAGPRTVSPVLKSGAVIQTGPSYTPGSSFSYYYQPSTIDPNTGNPWASGTVAAAGSADLGVTIVT
jgi:hypothetical protein